MGTPTPPPCPRCGNRTELATIANIADRPTVYVRPPEYVFWCPQCKRGESYYVDFRSGSWISMSTGIQAVPPLLAEQDRF
jgi:hypothetical protein